MPTHLRSDIIWNIIICDEANEVMSCDQSHALLHIYTGLYIAKTFSWKSISKVTTDGMEATM